MLYTFLIKHRQALISRCKFKVAQRSEVGAHTAASEYGIPLFLDQLIKTLRIETTSQPQMGKTVSGAAGGPSEESELGKAATLHGRELSECGFTVEQVVHDYGDLCQAITDLATELEHPIEADEFRTLNRCLDNGIADAVTEFTHHRRLINDDRDEQVLHRHLSVIMHDLRIHIDAATHAVHFIKSGKVGFDGATGTLLDRSLAGLKNISDRALAGTRLSAGLPASEELLLVSDFLTEVKTSMEAYASSKGCEFNLSLVGLGLAVKADRALLFSAVANLLENAFKFTRQGTKVTLTAYADGERILMDVQDHCGGLPPGDKEELFQPFVKKGWDTSGYGLGLANCRRAVEAINGILSVRDLPGYGCIFTISLHRHHLAPLSSEMREQLV